MVASVCVRVFMWPAKTFCCDTNWGHELRAYPTHPAKITTPIIHKFENAMFFFKHLGTDTCDVNAQGHGHAHAHQHARTRTCIHRWGSSAFNPSRLVSGGVPVQGPCPLYWSDWTWGGLPVLREETCMWWMKGQWEQKKDWQRTQWDKARQWDNPSGL